MPRRVLAAAAVSAVASAVAQGAVFTVGPPALFGAGGPLPAPTVAVAAAA